VLIKPDMPMPDAAQLDLLSVLSGAAKQSAIDS
jgi:hypothetical protein